MVVIPLGWISDNTMKEDVLNNLVQANMIKSYSYDEDDCTKLTITFNNDTKLTIRSIHSKIESWLDYF